MTLDVNSVEPIIPCVYYNCDELNDAVFHDNELLIFTHSIRSINRNFENLSLLLDNIKSNIDVIVLSKTWITEELCCDIDGLESYHVVRINRVGGGVSVYVRSSLQSNILPDFTLVEENGEICAVEVIPDKGNPNSKCIVLGIYSLPDDSLFNSHSQFLFTTIKLWNSLSAYLKEIDDSNLFRASLKSWISSYL